jgi:hypothetical protein
LVSIAGLAPGTTTEYVVRVDGEVAWPPAGSTRPPCRIRTLAKDGPVHIAFGSCRYATTAALPEKNRFDADSLACYARTLAALDDDEEWPQAFLMLGDQVYADETSDATKERIRRRRDIATGAGEQVADFEEYTWLYAESWTDPDVRWLMSTVSISMIFDDHDVRDDWNTSHAWRVDMQATSWWRERIIGALSSYWVYQHLGNLSPAELADNDLYQRIRAGADATAALRRFAEEADAEADGLKGTQWSYRRDLGRVRLIMIDSRCGRILADGRRSMVSDVEFDWIREQVCGNYDHLLVGTSLPWLMPRALHDLESWNEALCDGARGPRLARWAETMRRAGDLEHWAAFRKSFDRLAALLAAVARGELVGPDGRAPATVCVLSGDVHHAYVAKAHCARPVESQIYQLTCSPLHNRVPALMKAAFRIAWSRAAERLTRRLLGLVSTVPPASIEWTREAGPYFGNEVATLRMDGRKAEVTLDKSAPAGVPAELTQVARVVLSSE